MILANTNKPKYVNNKSNSLVYQFANINTKKFDVCLTLSYKSSKSVTLNANYIVDQTKSSLFSLALKKATNDDHVNFCMSDFVHTVNEKFELEFTVTVQDEVYDENAFGLINFKAEAQPHKRLDVNFIESWINIKNLDVSDQHKKEDQNWRFVPKSMRHKSGRYQRNVLPVEWYAIN